MEKVLGGKPEGCLVWACWFLTVYVSLCDELTPRDDLSRSTLIPAGKTEHSGKGRGVLKKQLQVGGRSRDLCQISRELENSPPPRKATAFVKNEGKRKIKKKQENWTESTCQPVRHARTGIRN